MNKCKNCGFWGNIESTDMGICRCLFAYEQRGYAPVQIVPFCVERTREAETHMFFGCVYFKEKDRGPFSVEKHEAKTYNSWYISFCNQVAPTLFPIQKVAKRWCDWLNELWAQKEKEPPDKNCPVCISFPCWTHQFFTGHIEFCCGKFDRRGPSNCGIYYYCGRNICPCDKWSPKE